MLVLQLILQYLVSQLIFLSLVIFQILWKIYLLLLIYLELESINLKNMKKY